MACRGNTALTPEPLWLYLRRMDRSKLWTTFATAATIALFGTAPYWADAGWWGVNHLIWLPDGFRIGFWIIATTALALTVFRPREQYIDPVIGKG